MGGIGEKLRIDIARERIRGVYAITPDEPNTELLSARVSDALAGGVRLIQYRNKAAGKRLAHEQALALRHLTAEVGAQLIINDDIELALEVSADGVHLGRDDGHSAAEDARVDFDSLRRHAARSSTCRGTFMIGVSCYNEMDLARSAAAAGADYVAFGSVFPSTTKPLAVRAALSLIQRAKQELSLPVVAIGGITPENAPQLLAAGADAVAVISSLFGGRDIRARAFAFTSIFPNHV